MSKQGLSLTPLETRFFAWSQLYKRRIVRTGDLLKELAISAKQEAKLFAKANKSGLIIKITRGVYLLPNTLPARAWSPSEYYLLSLLMQEREADYQVTGLAALNFHKLSTQIPNQLTVYNTKLSGAKKIGKINFTFIKVDKNRLGETSSFVVKASSEELPVLVSSLERTIVDAVYDYQRFGAIPEVYDWIRTRRRDETFIKQLVKLTLRFGNISTQRRIGYLLDSLKVSPKITNPILKKLPQTNSLIPMIPQLPIRGLNNRKWGVVVNGKI